MKKVIRLIKYLFRYCFVLTSDEREIIKDDQRMISSYGEGNYFPDYRVNKVYFKLFK